MENTQKILSQILERAHVEMLVHGNENEQTANKLLARVMEVVGDMRDVYSNEMIKTRDFMLADGARKWHKYKAIDLQTNATSSTVYNRRMTTAACMCIYRLDRKVCTAMCARVLLCRYCRCVLLALLFEKLTSLRSRRSINCARNSNWAILCGWHRSIATALMACD